MKLWQLLTRIWRDRGMLDAEFRLYPVLAGAHLIHEIKVKPLVVVNHLDLPSHALAQKVEPPVGFFDPVTVLLGHVRVENNDASNYQLNHRATIFRERLHRAGDTVAVCFVHMVRLFLLLDHTTVRSKKTAPP